MSYTQEQIDRANQVDLKEFLCSHGEQVTKSGNEYRWKRHDSLTIQGNKWFRYSQSKGGYPVEFVMEFFGKNFPEAMLMLIGEAPANNGTVAAPSEDFRLPPRNRYVARAMAYLRQRNIPEELVQQTEVEWLWYPYIPFGKLTIIQGNPGEGKTFFAMQLVVACTNRKFLPQMEPFEPFNMIFQTAEDGLGDTVKPRLLSAEADLERVLVIDDADNPLTLADERIENSIRENHARLVIINPLQAFLGANVDMNRANEVRPIFRRLADVAQTTNCAIVMIGHLNKAVGSQSTYRGLGSIDITAVVRSLLFIGKVRTDPTTWVIVHEKSSLAPPGQSLAFSLGDEKGFPWIGAYDISAEDLLAGGEGSKTELKQEQAVKLIDEFLSEGRKVSIAEINKEAAERGISERTVRLARNSMGDKIASERQGKDWWIWFRE
jgi:hypothetical protein